MKKKSLTSMLLAILGLLILSELAATVISMFNGYGKSLNSACIITELVFTALYGFWLYKKPHGNMLKYAMLIYAASIFLVSGKCLINNYEYQVIYIIFIFIAGVVCYVAGRLERIEQNKYIMTLAAVAFLVLTIVLSVKDFEAINPLQAIRRFSGAISIITISVAYLVRYKEHREAGLVDAPNIK